MKEFPKISVLKEAIIKEHSEEGFNNALKQYRGKNMIRNPKIIEDIGVLLNTENFTQLPEFKYLAILVNVCRMLKVKIPYVYTHYPDKRDPEKVKRREEARNKARPPKINYEEEIKKIQEKYQKKIQQWCEGKTLSYNSYKSKEFDEIIDLYLARIREPHKPIEEDGGRPPYVVWSLAELNRSMIYIPKLPSDIRDDYDKLIGGFYKQYLSGESLDYRKIAGEILNYFQLKICQYETIVGWGK